MDWIGLEGFRKHIDEVSCAKGRGQFLNQLNDYEMFKEQYGGHSAIVVIT
jgi:hypothetical protein